MSAPGFEVAQYGLRGGAANIFDNMKHTITGRKSETGPKRKSKRVVVEEDEEDSLEKGLRIVKVKGDGRCLFRALVRICLMFCHIEERNYYMSLVLPTGSMPSAQFHAQR